jgi:dinuclear metal center YbgI/SA1388 family protein
MSRTAVPLAAVVAFLDQLLDIAHETDHEGNGLVVESCATVTRLGAALNTTLDGIRRAAEAGVDLLLVHHTSFSAIDLDLRPRKLDLLCQAGIALYAAHEALDRAPGFGTADTLAALLGVDVEERCIQGYGVYGRLTLGSFSALAARAHEVLDGPVQHWQNTSDSRRAAVVPGGAGLTVYLQEAQRLGCDTYVTGEGSMFTQLYAREVGLNLLLGSHYATEFPAVQALVRRVAQEFDLEWVALPGQPDIR